MIHRSRFLSFRSVALVVTGAAFLFACTAEQAVGTKTRRAPIEPGDDFYDDDIPALEEDLAPTSNEDSGAFGASSRPAASAAKDAGVDAAPEGGVVGPRVYCAEPLQAGDLAVAELLISSRSGSADDGEWVEIRSTRACWLKLRGLVVSSPRGTTASNSVQIAEDYELEPKGSFLVADSLDPAKNHGLRGKVFSWEASDVLKNDGDTIKVELGATVIDTLSYPSFSNLVPGRTLAFPDDCAWNVRADWERWSLTFAEWKPGFKGTPNATNDDVACY